MTLAFTVTAAIGSALLTVFASDYTGTALWSRVIFQLALGAIALFIAWTPLRRTALSEQSLPLLHDVSNELFDAHGMDELGTAVQRLAAPLRAPTHPTVPQQKK